MKLSEVAIILWLVLFVGYVSYKMGVRKADIYLNNDIKQAYRQGFKAGEQRTINLISIELNKRGINLEVKDETEKR